MFDPVHFVGQIQSWGRELGFSQIGVAGVDLGHAEAGLQAWLAAGFHGDMGYMAQHGLKRARPAELLPGTVTVLTARMDYLPSATQPDWVAQEQARAQRPGEAVVSLYARGRDYHKVLRQRLQRLAERIDAALQAEGSKDRPALQHRAFTDSAPVLEVELAAQSGLGWRGKHTLLLQRDAGSMFFLGEIFLNLALPMTPAVSAHCGQCTACLSGCPTGAIVGPQRVDARRCISYLTIEHPGAIPEVLRPALGNRIYGCDECQLVCPWNKYAQLCRLPDFDARPELVNADLTTLFGWDEATFLHRTEGSPIRRIGHERWLRNIAVALGNALAAAPNAPEAAAWRQALLARQNHPSALVREHVDWALRQPE